MHLLCSGGILDEMPQRERVEPDVNAALEKLK